MGQSPAQQGGEGAAIQGRFFPMAQSGLPGTPGQAAVSNGGHEAARGAPQVCTGPVDNTNDGSKHSTVALEVSNDAA